MTDIDLGLNLGNLQSDILVFGGPYSNYQATEAIRNIAEIKEIHPKNVICTGDVVAYCGEPEETVNLIRDWGCRVVMGNCEESLGFDKQDCGCGFEEGSVCATLSVDWYSHAVRKVSFENKSWMCSLPQRIRFQLAGLQFSVIHGGIEDISEFIFGSTDHKRKMSHLKTLNTDCVIGGHCGIPFGQNIQNKYWLNAGVIGMPANDGKKNGWYMMLQAREKDIIASWHTLDFDNRAAMAAMHKHALPDVYRDALSNGLWPSMSVLPEQERSQQAKEINLQPLTLQRH